MPRLFQIVLLVIVAAGIGYASRDAWWPKAPQTKVQYLLNTEAQKSFNDFMSTHLPSLKTALKAAGYILQEPDGVEGDGILETSVGADTADGIASGQADAHFCFHAMPVTPDEVQQATGLGVMWSPEFFLHQGRWFLLLDNGYVENYGASSSADYKSEMPPEVHQAIKTAFPDQMTRDQWAEVWRSSKK